MGIQLTKSNSQHIWNTQRLRKMSIQPENNPIVTKINII